MVQVNLKQQKNELREHYKQIRLKMTAEEKRRLDEKITNRLAGLWAFRECETFLTFVSKPIEVNTSGIINAAFRLGKRVAVPRCVAGTREMEFYFISSYDDLVPGAYGLSEPDPERCERATEFNNAFCLVPSIAFDVSGYRLGFGKGYYDRFLSRFDGKTSGACYSSCVCDCLPHGKYDRRSDMLATESRLYIFSDKS